MNDIDVNVETLDEDVQVPQYATEGSSGADVRAHIRENFTLQPGESTLVPTGLKFEIPAGYEIQVRPRSGHAFKYQVTVLNTPGTIDSDYCGELKVILINHGKDPFVIEPQMKIAQIIFSEVTHASFNKIEKVAVDTARGEGGFGHTGKF
ncbi:MAG: Deoxyuridine 5'-triphosphate nucleotidohydrolase [Chlamydiae bacterium]|nr:Deoxyuridine 5'-triphosphate nucleotidohydrolase [Chlamydiota bacterium]